MDEFEEYEALVVQLLREHAGYDGDGHGGRGALPEGDYSTTVWQLRKIHLRRLFLAGVAPIKAATQIALAAADRAEEAASNAVVPDGFIEREKLAQNLNVDTPLAFTSTTEIRSAPAIIHGQRAEIPGRIYRYDADIELTDNGVSILKPAGIDIDDPGRWVMQPGTFSSTFELTFGNAGSGADFTDLEDALNFCSRFRPEYAYGRSFQGRAINLRFLAGTILDQGMCLTRGQDLGYVRLIADDPVVKVNFPTDIWWAYAEYNSRLPLFSAIFDMQGIGYDGLALKHSSKVCFEYLGDTPISGVINSARHNVFLNTDCHGSFRKGKFTGSGASGIHLEKASYACAREADVSRNAASGVELLGNSSMDIYGINADFCGVYGVLSDGGSQAAGYGVSARDCGDAALRATNGGRIVTPNANFGTVDSGSSWAYATDGSFINMQNSVGTGGITCAYASLSSEIIASGVNASGNSGWGFRIDGGSIIRATGTTGTTNQTPNTLTGSGIIFR